jgi:anti-sigma B factor antagonist
MIASLDGTLVSNFEATPATDAAGAPLLRVSGDLDLAAAPKLLGAAGDLEPLRLDLGGVTFMDSTGLGALITLRNQAQERGVDVEIVAASRAVERVLEISGLGELFGRPA